MRHTLLPLPERIALRREYYLRILVVLFFMISVAGLLGITAIFPAYIATVIEGKSVQKDSSGNAKDQDLSPDFGDIRKEMIRSQTLLSILAADSESKKISELIGGIVHLREDVLITSIVATKVSSTTFTATIQGIAPTRNSLISLKSRFEAAKSGNSANLPISELTSSTNIHFAMQLKEKMP